MSTTSSRPTRPATSAPTQRRNFLSEITTDAKPKPTAFVLYAPPGLGKTSFGAAIPNRIFLIDDQEDGISTLKNSGLVDPGIPVFPAASSWTDVLGMLESLATEDHGHKALVIDTLGGLERLCHAEVCEREFKGEWGDKGFGGYQRGYEVSLPEWRRLLNALDRLRIEKGMTILGLAHSLVRPYKNPAGEDYDRFIPDMHHKTWAVTHKWADMVLFANYDVEVDKGRSGKERGKGKGGQTRTMHTEYHAAFEAKNRHGLPDEIDMGNSGQEAWNNLKQAIIDAKNKKGNE